MADWGVKITKPGFDVLTETDDRNFVYSTKYSGMKILKHNTRATPGAVAHGVSGYIPGFINFVLSGGKYRINNYVTTSTADYTDSTNINFGGSDNYYFIFVDRGD